MKKLLFLFCIISLTFVSCNSSKSVVKLTDSKWTLVSMDNKPLQLKGEDNEVFLQFNEAEKKVSGRAGCNRFFGTYEQNGKKLKFSQIGATRMACPDINMEVESKFFQVLDKTGTFSIKDNELSLINDESVLATFKMAKTQE